MGSRWLDRIAAIISVSMAVTGAWAQEGAAPAKDEQKDEPEAQAPKWNLLTIGYYGYDYSGFRRSLRRYASPPDGLALKELRLLLPGEGGKAWGRLNLNGTVDHDSTGEGLLIFLDGKATLRGSYAKNEFFDWTPVVVDKSKDREYEARFTYALTPEIGAYWTYDEKSKDHKFEGPKDPEDTRTKAYAGGVEGRFLGGQGGVQITDRRFFDRNGSQPNSIQHRIDAHFGRELIKGISAEGVYNQTKIEQTGMRDSDVKAIALNADWALGEDTYLTFSTRKEDLKMPNVENAYVRQRFSTGVRLSSRLAGMAFDGGYQHREIERVRGDQTYTDLLNWNTLDAKLSGKVFQRVRWSARYSWDHLSDAAAMVTLDPRQLYWDDRVKVQAKLDTDCDRFAGYLTYTFRYDQNSPRSVEVRSHNLTLGGSYSFSDRTSLFAEMANDTYEAKGVVDTGLSLDDFFPSSTTLAFGVDHTFNPNQSISLSVTRYYTRNANPLMLSDGNYNGTEITAQYRHRLNDNTSIDVLFAPWRHTDKLEEALSYRTTVFGVSCSFKF